MLNALLEDIMCDHPIKVKENIDVGSVVHLLMRYRISGILVVKKNNTDKLVGVFTITDVLRLMNEALSKGAHRIDALKKTSQLRVGKVATKTVISLQKDAKVTKAIAIMHKKNIHTIPVYDKDKLIGVIGRHDILDVALNYY